MVVTTGSSLSVAQAVINSQNAAIDLLTLESLHTLNGALHINEVCVGESSWLAGASVNGNTDINDISNVTEELVEVRVGHFEGKVTDEEGLGRWVAVFRTAGLALVVDNETAAFINCLMLGLDGSGGLIDRAELNVSETSKHVSYKSEKNM